MPDQISRVDYYSAIVPDKVGEGARILTALEEAGITLTVFSGFPEGRKAQMDFVVPDAAAFVKAAKQARLQLSRKKTAFLVQGDDHPGAVADIARKLAAVNVGIVSMQALCAGNGRYGGILWVAPADVRKAAKALGA